MEFIFDIIGSITPDDKLFLGFPFIRSSPQYLRSDFDGSVPSTLKYSLCNALNFEISYVASFAAFVANVFGITFKASLN